jgi:hypothetical protein
VSALEIQSVCLAHLATQGIPALTEVPVLGGIARADIVAIKEEAHGFEIKSHKDTLRRLPSQVASYAKTFSTVSIICAENHLGEINTQIPRWFGLILYKKGQLIGVRKAKANPIVAKPFILNAITKKELIGYTKRQGLNIPIEVTQSTCLLKKHLKHNLSLTEVQRMFAQCLRARVSNFA